VNRIQMYSSSTDLRVGLHRVLATSHALAFPFAPGTRNEWWTCLDDESTHGAARQHQLPLTALAQVFGSSRVQEILAAARRQFGLDALDEAALTSAFRAAIISGKAHRAHGGRDVYGISNKGLWDLVCAPWASALAMRFGDTLGEASRSIADSAPAPRALELLQELTRFDTSPDGDGHPACVDWLQTRLRHLGFTTTTIGEEHGRPIVVARRDARGDLGGHVVLYGHYDVTPFGRESKWRFPPRELTVTEGRLFARGVADNKGPLACRLAALEAQQRAPALTWLIQGEEETGSTAAHAVLPEVMAELADVTLWLDETGYHDHEDGTLRLLARTIAAEDSSDPIDVEFQLLLRGLTAHASRWAIASRHEQRGLNKNVVAGGCPFNKNLPVGGRYLALGVNDSKARIHGVDESLPGWTFPLHAEQLGVVFEWANWISRSTR